MYEITDLWHCYLCRVPLKVVGTTPRVCTHFFRMKIGHRQLRMFCYGLFNYGILFLPVSRKCARIWVLRWAVTSNLYGNYIAALYLIILGSNSTDSLIQPFTHHTGASELKPNGLFTQFG